MIRSHEPIHPTPSRSDPSPEIPAPSPRHIPALDGLRGLAILLVVTYHYFTDDYTHSFGWSGVDLFFVLSGYLITGRLLDHQRRPGYFTTFYRNRALRILPLYYGALIVFFAGIRIFAKEETLPFLAYYSIHWKSFFLFTENWIFILYGLPVAPYLLHFWSLAVEEQFYLVWPLLVYLLASRRSRIRLWMILPFIVIAIRTIFFLTSCRFNTICRIDSFIIGALLCELHRAKIRIPVWTINLLFALSASAIAVSAVVFRNLDPYNPFFSTIGYTFTALLYACILHRSVEPGQALITWIFNFTILRFLGKISYGLYVFHVPVLFIFQKRWTDWGIRHVHANESIAWLTATLCCLALSLLLSFLSFRYFESFFLRLKKN